MTVLIPDTSEWNPNADEAGIAAQNGGASIIRVCYGSAHPDHVFRAKRADAHAAHMTFLPLYQYLTAFLGQSVAAQADAYCKLVGELRHAEIPLCDLEEGNGDQSGRFHDWAARVERSLGKRPWLYAGMFYAIDHGLAPLFNGTGYHTHVAAYGRVEPALGHTLWQSTNGTAGSHVTAWPGCGRCDTSVYHGNIGDLAALTGHPAPPPVPHHPPGGPLLITTDGKLTFAEICHAHGTTPMGVLRRTCEASPGGQFADNVADWGNGVFHGTASVHDDVPAGLKLVVRQ
jgi:hypothetical protein